MAGRHLVRIAVQRAVTSRHGAEPSGRGWAGGAGQRRSWLVASPSKRATAAA
jgi:hypothetical protein